MTKLSLNEPVMTGIVKMSDGNPGGAVVLTELLRKDKFMDVMWLDEWEIYGSDLWVLYKDCCGQNIDNVIRVINNVRLGKFSKEALKNYINLGAKFNFEEMEV